MNAVRTCRHMSVVECLEIRQMCYHVPHVIPAFKETDLVSNIAGKARTTDASLTNPWGIAFNPSFDVIWTANNGAGNSTVYNADGTVADTGGLYNSITIPAPGAGDTSAPTGEVFNTSSSFTVKKGSVSGTAAYVFSTEDGTIAAWNPSVDPVNAITEVDRSASRAIYKGLAEASHKGKQFLYATDFHNGKVDAFKAGFKSAGLASNAFTDPHLPKHFAPFGIQNIGGNLYVTYAKKEAGGDDDVSGAANGVVDVYSFNGQLLRRFATGGTLNSPWGVVKAPSGFGKLGGDLLVGNFGDGKISAFNPDSGKLVGYVGGTNGKAIVIGGLWGMTFGPAKTDSNTLFFTAGPNDEADGLLGTLSNSKLKKSALSSSPY